MNTLNIPGLENNVFVGSAWIDRAAAPQEQHIAPSAIGVGEGVCSCDITADEGNEMDVVEDIDKERESEVENEGKSEVGVGSEGESEGDDEDEDGIDGEAGVSGVGGSGLNMQVCSGIRNRS